jgi:hypothetical protein
LLRAVAVHRKPAKIFCVLCVCVRHTHTHRDRFFLFEIFPVCFVFVALAVARVIAVGCSRAISVRSSTNVFLLVCCTSLKDLASRKGCTHTHTHAHTPKYNQVPHDHRRGAHCALRLVHREVAWFLCLFGGWLVVVCLSFFSTRHFDC